MFQKLKSDYLSWIMLIGAFFLLLDIFFFNRGSIFSLIVAAGMIYLGRKWLPKMRGKLLFAAGIIFLAVNALNMLVIKFLFLALLGVYIYQYAQRKKHPDKITPIIHQAQKRSANIVAAKPLFQNRLFGGQKTPDHVYEWNDINIYNGFGDSVIDLSYTVLPKGESVIFIRSVMGKVTILVPYDIEISVHHSVLFGSVRIFDYEECALFNKLLTIHTEDYEHAKQKVKIFTSTMIGDIEVKRV
ncbi:cell wall-active antibiotics response protein LiaF [Bacillus benzoevorans]|uniref:Lia operon protein LiaF n=1 Tax=Bacillus benzoevorans TaxID=1456 RepID=A0A7X0HWR4_9BACI|nr:cell wall-active antibiotics response protein LiaF [Bacillus benzoevorans]MBB6447332.1 lia operon protein LiaF [Bacillus benzoevorans]